MIFNTAFNKKIYMVKVMMGIFVITFLMCSMAYGIDMPDSGLIPTYFQGGYSSIYQVPYNSYEYNSIDFYKHDFLNQKVIDYRVPDFTTQITHGICPSPAMERIESMSIWGSLFGLDYYNPVGEANPQPSPFPIPWLHLSNGFYGNFDSYSPVGEANPQPSPFPIPWLDLSDGFYGDLGIDTVPTSRIFPDMCIGIRP